MIEDKEFTRCEDYNNCDGCKFKKIIEIDNYSDSGNYIDKETILFCERNGKIDDVFRETAFED